MNQQLTAKFLAGKWRHPGQLSRRHRHREPLQSQQHSRNHQRLPRWLPRPKDLVKSPNKLSISLFLIFFCFRNDGADCNNRSWRRHRKRSWTRNHRNVQRRLVVRCWPPPRPATATDRQPTTSCNFIARSVPVGSVRMGNQAVPAVRPAAVRSHALRRFQRSHPSVQVVAPHVRWIPAIQRAIFVSTLFLSFAPQIPRSS